MGIPNPDRVNARMMQEVAMSVQTFMELSTKNHCAPAEQNGENVIRKSLSLLGVVLLPGLLIANAP